MLTCKICRIPLIDNSYFLDVEGAMRRKEEYICPNEEDHGEIVEKRIINRPKTCPVCESSRWIETETQIYKNVKGEIVISCELICSCGFIWSLISNSVEATYDDQQLSEYGEN